MRKRFAQPPLRALTNAGRRLGRLANPLLLGLTLSTDCVFLVLHVLNGLSSAPNALLNAGRDGGYAEVFQYIKEYWIALLLLAIMRRTRESIYGVWALLFAYLLCDDATRIHERAGASAAIHWDFTPVLGLRAHDLGEFVVSVAVGATLLVPIAYGYFCASPAARVVSINLIVLLGVLVFFGVAVDMLHAVAHTRVKGLTVIEDGGEMVTMSLIVSYAAHLQQHLPDRPSPSS